MQRVTTSVCFRGVAFFRELVDERYTWKDVRLVLERWKDLDPVTERLVYRMEEALVLLKHGKVTADEVLESFRE